MVVGMEIISEMGAIRGFLCSLSLSLSLSLAIEIEIEIENLDCSAKPYSRVAWLGGSVLRKLLLLYCNSVNGSKARGYEPG